MLWSSHPRKLRCDAVGPEVDGAIPDQVRCCWLLVWQGQIFANRFQSDEKGLVYDFTSASSVSNRSVAYPPGSPALCLGKITSRNGNQQKEQSSVSLSFYFLHWFLSSFLHRALGETILEIPISSAKKLNKKNENKEIPKKRAHHHIIPGFLCALGPSLFLHRALGETNLEIPISSAKKRKKR